MVFEVTNCDFKSIFEPVAICGRFCAQVMASRLALPKKGNGSLLNGTMKAKIEASNQDDANGFIQLNYCVPQGGIAAKVQRKK